MSVFTLRKPFECDLFFCRPEEEGSAFKNLSKARYRHYVSTKKISDLLVETMNLLNFPQKTCLFQDIDLLSVKQKSEYLVWSGPGGE